MYFIITEPYRFDYSYSGEEINIKKVWFDLSFLKEIDFKNICLQLVTDALDKDKQYLIFYTLNNKETLFDDKFRGIINLLSLILGVGFELLWKDDLPLPAGLLKTQQPEFTIQGGILRYIKINGSIKYFNPYTFKFAKEEYLTQKQRMSVRGGIRETIVMQKLGDVRQNFLKSNQEYSKLSFHQKSVFDFSSSLYQFSHISDNPRIKFFNLWSSLEIVTEVNVKSPRMIKRTNDVNKLVNDFIKNLEDWFSEEDLSRLKNRIFDTEKFSKVKRIYEKMSSLKKEEIKEAEIQELYRLRSKLFHPTKLVSDSKVISNIPKLENIVRKMLGAYIGVFE